MADRYSCFEELAANEREDVDYKISIEQRSSLVAIIAPHGGRIEPMTTETARLIAGADFNFYSFIGIAERGRNRELHVTSHNFDEPKCLGLISDCDIVVAIHGRKDKEDKDRIYLGGLDVDLRDRIGRNLVKSRFSILTTNHPFSAKNAMNICNRGRRRKGAQLELPKMLRDQLSIEDGRCAAFAGVIRLSILDHINGVE